MYLYIQSHKLISSFINKLMNDKNYTALLTEIKQKIQEAQIKTVMAANSQMLFLYWQLGNLIIQNQ